jgi:hypothetical protein
VRVIGRFRVQIQNLEVLTTQQSVKLRVPVDTDAPRPSSSLPTSRGPEQRRKSSLTCFLNARTKM